MNSRTEQSLETMPSQVSSVEVDDSNACCESSSNEANAYNVTYREIDDSNELFSLTNDMSNEGGATSRDASQCVTCAARLRQFSCRWPGMFGDFYGASSLQVLNQNQLLANIPLGGAVRRVKIAEKNSPIPSDRFFFNYNFFNDVFGGIGDVNRYTLGFERTFNGGICSVAVLCPFASTLDSNQVLGGQRATDTEFGDINVILKTILLGRDTAFCTGGLGVTAPTGPDTAAVTTNGAKFIDIDYGSVHLLPFLAALVAHDWGWYVQSFLQLDFEAMVQMNFWR